jgi:bifunctional non-homologous end joining protein LigD
MGLQRYREKRAFERAPAPRPRALVPATRKLRFVIQKHAASTLHYDLRLEIEGVLKSWAIPKDPSKAGAQKRLAVRTQDHPLAYAGFQGNVTDDDGAGKGDFWDEGTWVPEGSPVTSYRRGNLQFELKGRKMKGHWALVRMGNASTRKKDLWILVRRDDTP